MDRQVGSAGSRMIKIFMRLYGSIGASHPVAAHKEPCCRILPALGRGTVGRFLCPDDFFRSGASKRTLARHMQMVLGKSPLSYFQSLRVERAVHLLKTSSASVDGIAVRVG